jgi:gliding motility-associated lipoprotein GldH
MKKLLLLVLLPALLIVAACDRDRVYEQNVNIEGNAWYIDSVATFEFEVADLNTNYDIYYNVRNSLDYPFYNLYVSYYLEDSTGKQISSNLHEMELMDAKTGKPHGSGISNIYDHQFLALSDVKFPYAGKYFFRIKQYMRQDPLPEIYSIGIRVEKAQSE